VRLYAWNMEVSAAFLGPLNCAEVVMRNAMHDQLSRLFGGPVWWDHPRMALLGPGQNGIDVVKQRLSLRPGPIIADQVIAELTFGFWVSLLGRGNNYHTRL
jgi:hypothetical protein